MVIRSVPIRQPVDSDRCLRLCFASAYKLFPGLSGSPDIAAFVIRLYLLDDSDTEEVDKLIPLIAESQIVVSCASLVGSQSQQSNPKNRDRNNSNCDLLNRVLWVVISRYII